MAREILDPRHNGVGKRAKVGPPDQPSQRRDEAALPEGPGVEMGDTSLPAWSSDGFEPGPTQPAPASRLRLSNELKGQTARVIVRGEIDVSNSSKVAGALSAALATTASTVILDLGAVTFIDSAGIGMLLGAAERSSRDRNRLRIVPSRAVARLTALGGLQDCLPFNELATSDT